MEKIKELPPGTRHTYCAHLMIDSPYLSDELKVRYAIVYLEEIPEEIGYHGTCSECGSKYFSRPNGAF